MEETLSKDHDDHIAEKGFHSLSHHNLVHKFVPMLQAIKNLDATAAVDKGWEKLEKLPSWQMTNVKSRKGGHSGSAKRAKNSPFCIADGHLTHPKKCGVGADVSKVYRPGCAPR